MPTSRTYTDLDDDDDYSSLRSSSYQIYLNLKEIKRYVNYNNYATRKPRSLRIL